MKWQVQSNGMIQVLSSFIIASQMSGHLERTRHKNLLIGKCFLTFFYKSRGSKKNFHFFKTNEKSVNLNFFENWGSDTLIMGNILNNDLTCEKKTLKYIPVTKLVFQGRHLKIPSATTGCLAKPSLPSS